MLESTVPVVLFGRFSTLAGASTFATLPVNVVAYETAMIHVWRGRIAPTSTFALALKESNDGTVWTVLASGDPAAPSLATPPAFPGTLGVDPRLPEGAGSRASLLAQEGHVRPSEPVPSTPAGTQKAGMADASGAEGPEDEQGVGPFGGGGAQYAASLGLSTPEPMRIDDRGRADLSGYRGKSNGIAHEWAQAEVDKRYALDKAAEASREAAAQDQAAREMEKDNQEKYDKGEINEEQARERDKRRQEADAKAAEKRAEAERWEEQADEAEARQKRADKKIERSGDKDKIRDQARQDVGRLERRKERADARAKAAAARAAQRLRRKGMAWRRNRRHQRNERQRARDRRRERRLERRLSEESMKRWSAAQKEIERLRAEIEEIDNELDDPRTPPDKREALEEEKRAKENELRGHLLDQYWEEHGGFPCDEIDCCDPNYAKCRPACNEKQKCICEKSKDCPKDEDKNKEKKNGGGNGDDQGADGAGTGDDKGPVTRAGSPGKHVDKNPPPPVEPDPAGGRAAGEKPPERESPDDGFEDWEDGESPDDGRAPGKRDRQKGPREKGAGGKGEPPLVFGKGDEAHKVYQGKDGQWYLVWDDGSVYRLKTEPPLLRTENGRKVYDLAGVERDAEPINDVGKILNNIAGAVQGFLGDKLELAQLILKRYENETLRQIVEQYAKEGTVDKGAVVWLAAIWVAGSFGHLKFGELTPGARRVKAQLQKRGVKFDTDVVDAFKAKDGRLLFYEARDLAHQIEKHAQDFAAFGIGPEKIHKVTRAALENGTRLGTKRTQGTLYEVYEVAFEGRRMWLQLKVNPSGAVGGGNPITSLVGVVP